MRIEGICLITDRTHTAMTVREMTALAVTSGIRFIQYREKQLTRRSIFEEAMHLREITARAGALLIINDHADIALAVDADGVHLGQDDLPLSEARKIMGNRIIGISTHNPDQALTAEAGGADYIGFGPVFRTTTKDAGPPVGLDGLRLVRKQVGIPVVAIGGITLGNVRSVFEAGADSAAVATGILKGTAEANARNFVTSWERWGKPGMKR